MSADNRICYMQNDQGEWAVWHGSGSIDYCEPPPGAATFATQKAAMAEVERLEKAIDYLEYGAGAIGQHEQATGLRQTIEHYQERLRRLETTGSQFRPQD